LVPKNFPLLKDKRFLGEFPQEGWTQTIFRKVFPYLFGTSRVPKKEVLRGVFIFLPIIRWAKEEGGGNFSTTTGYGTFLGGHCLKGG